VANPPRHRTNAPNAAESDYWGGFQFSEGHGNQGRTYINLPTNYSGPLPAQYPGLITLTVLVGVLEFNSLSSPEEPEAAKLNLRFFIAQLPNQRCHGQFEILPSQSES
jgi:hypothetical protein